MTPKQHGRSEGERNGDADEGHRASAERRNARFRTGLSEELNEHERLQLLRDLESRAKATALRESVDAMREDYEILL